MQIAIENISKKYGRKTVLSGASFAASSGECIGILGVNGCGKSTLLSILAGVLKSDGGAFVCDGVDLLRAPSELSKTVGFVPQGTPLIEELSAKDNLSLWYSRKAMQQALQSGALSMLGIGEFLNKRVSKLSGGMKKRLSIGCAIAGKPRILLLDEPMSALDIFCKQNIKDYLQAYKQSGGILVLVTHDALELSLCDRCYLLKDGKLQEFSYSGDSEQLVNSLL